MSQGYRIEKDSLGELAVPSDAYYGAQTQRAVHNFPISGLWPWQAFIWSMAILKRAAAELVKEAMKRNLTIREVAAERIAKGELTHKDDANRAVTLAEVDSILGDLKKLTEGGIQGMGAAG